jgi:hypothetical protein
LQKIGKVLKNFLRIMSSIQKISTDCCQVIPTEKKELEKETYGDCAICMEKLDESKNFARTNCKHAFCLTCLVRSLKDNNTCPLCRQNIEEENPKKTKSLELYDLLEVAKEEIEMFAWRDHLDAIMHFDTPQTSLKNMLKVFSVGLVRSIIAHHGEEDDEEWEVEDSDEEEE